MIISADLNLKIRQHAKYIQTSENALSKIITIFLYQKKRKVTKCFLLLATCAGMLAACNSNTTNPLQIQTRIIDSTVNANVTKHDAENAAKMIRF